MNGAERNLWLVVLLLSLSCRCSSFSSPRESGRYSRPPRAFDLFSDCNQPGVEDVGTIEDNEHL